MDISDVKLSFNGFNFNDFKAITFKEALPNVIKFETTAENARVGKGLVIEATRAVSYFDNTIPYFGIVTDEEFVNLGGVNKMNEISNKIIRQQVNVLDRSTLNLAVEACVKNNLDNINSTGMPLISPIKNAGLPLIDHSNIESPSNSNINTYLVILGVVVIAGVVVYAYNYWC